MLLREFIRDNPERKLILLWFNNEELQTKYCYPHKLSSKAMKMLDMEVMETETYDEEDWIEVWLK